MRRSIIHKRGIAIDDVEKCSILTWFRAGDEISISGKQFEMLVSHIKCEINELPQKIRDIKHKDAERKLTNYSAWTVPQEIMLLNILSITKGDIQIQGHRALCKGWLKLISFSLCNSSTLSLSE